MTIRMYQIGIWWLNIVDNKMKEPTYRGSVLKRNSDAYRLWETWQKTKDAEDRDKLDKHMKQLDLNEKLLLKRYTNGV